MKLVLDVSKTAWCKAPTSPLEDLINYFIKLLKEKLLYIYQEELGSTRYLVGLIGSSNDQ